MTPKKSGAARVYEALGDTDFDLKSSRCSRASLLAHACCCFAFPLAQWPCESNFLDTYSCRYSSGF
ncbi:MAG: hypothetical protein RL440_1224 [Bacteroidota bacterium]|jgi:hypothetical protein